MDERASYLPSAGTLIAGKYRVEGSIGEGGMAVVLAATHEGLRSRVAVKVLQPKYAASAELRERFFREARALAALHSEHITRVFDVGTLETGAAYLVLEHLDGYDLHEALQKGGPMPWRQAVGYILQACEGLRAAHDHGVLHRDLKPSNMFLVPQTGGPGSAGRSEGGAGGLIKLLDFGLAKLKEEGVSALTGAEAVMGSPSYMAPEQIKGLSNADERSDIWSVGVSLYELIADGYPFEADTAMKIAAAVIVEKPKPLAQRAPGLPPGLEEVIMACLVKDPAKRTRSAEELIGKLKPFANLKGYDSMPAPRPPRLLVTEPGEATYGGLMDEPVSSDATAEDKATLVQLEKPVPAEAPSAEARDVADDDDDGREDMPTLEKAPSARAALAARASESADTELLSLAKTMRASSYDPNATMREARSRYFDQNRLGPDGGYDAAWAELKLGAIPFPFPNTAARTRAAKVHDLHHIVTGYGTGLVGEFEIAAWELGAGCGPYVAAWGLNLGSLAGGLLVAPDRTFRAFVRGRNSESLYGKDVDAMLDERVAVARMMLGVDQAMVAKATGADVALFVLAEIAGFVVAGLSLAIGAALLPLGLLLFALRRRSPQLIR